MYLDSLDSPNCMLMFIILQYSPHSDLVTNLELISHMYDKEL